MVVKPLFPPVEKKGVNDTLGLLTPTHHSSLSFMEGEHRTQSSHWRGGHGDSYAALPPRFNKKDRGGGAIAVIIITKYNIIQ